MRKFGYCRVSTEKQAKKNDKGEYFGSLKDQMEELKAKGVEETRIEMDIASGKDFNRKGIDNLLLKMEKGDELFVYRLDRLGRNTKEMLEFVDEFTRRGIVINFINEGISTKGEMGKMVITILSAVATAERFRILERTEEGRKSARDNGIKFGRKTIVNVDRVKELHQQGLNNTQIAKELRISRASVIRVLKLESNAE